MTNLSGQMYDGKRTVKDATRVKEHSRRAYLYVAGVVTVCSLLAVIVCGAPVVLAWRIVFGRVPTNEEVIGTYAAGNYAGKEILVIKPDKTFEHGFLCFRTGQIWQCSATWLYDEGRGELVLEGALPGLRANFTGQGLPIGSQDARWTTPLRPRRFGTEIRMQFNPDTGLAFRKITDTGKSVLEYLENERELVKQRYKSSVASGNGT